MPNLVPLSRCGASASLRAAEAFEERAAHHALGRRYAVEQLESELALIYQHPGAVSMSTAKRDRLAQKRRWLGAIDGIIEKAIRCEVAA